MRLEITFPNQDEAWIFFRYYVSNHLANGPLEFQQCEWCGGTISWDLEGVYQIEHLGRLLNGARNDMIRKHPPQLELRKLGKGAYKSEDGRVCITQSYTGGPWFVRVYDHLYPTEHKTKRDAVQQARRILGCTDSVNA